MSSSYLHWVCHVQTLCCMPAVTRTWRAGCGGRYMPGVRRHAPRGGLGGAPQRGAPRIHRVGAAAHSESPPAAAPFSATLRSRMRCFFFSFFSRWYLVVRYEMEAVVRYNTVPVALARLVCSACSRLGEPWHAPSLRSRGADVEGASPGSNPVSRTDKRVSSG